MIDRGALFVAFGALVLAAPAAATQRITVKAPGLDVITAPRVISGGGGDAAVVWVQARPRRVYATVVDSTGRVEPRSLLGGPREHAGQAQAAMNPSGRVLVAWTRAHERRLTIRMAEHRPGQRGFTKAVTLSRGRSSDNSAIAINSHGAAVVAWVRQRSHRCGRSVIDIRSRSGPGRAFGPVTSFVATSERRGYCTAPPRVAIDTAGQYTVVWTRVGGVSNFSAIVAASGHAGDRATASVQVSPRGVIAEGPQVVTSAAGATTVAWRYPANQDELGIAQRPAGVLAFRPPTALDHGQTAKHLVLSTSASGDILVAWASTSQIDGRELQTVIAARQPPGGPFGVPDTLGGPCFNTSAIDVVVAPDGYAAVAWNGFENDAIGWSAHVALGRPGATFDTLRGLPEHEMLTSTALTESALLVTSTDSRYYKQGAPQPVSRRQITLSRFPRERPDPPVGRGPEDHPGRADHAASADGATEQLATPD